MAVFEGRTAAGIRSPFSGPRADLGHRAHATDTIIIVVAVIGGLYFGRDILVPIALAVVLSFVLAPIADALGRLRIGRAASVLVTVFLAVAVLGILSGVIGKQLAELADNLPQYQIVISNKLDALRTSDVGKGLTEKASEALHGLNSKIVKPTPENSEVAPTQTSQAPGESQRLLPVEVHDPAPGPVQILQSVLSALLPPLATGAVVVIFVIFILLQRGDLRDRFIGLVGARDMHRTTKALGDAAERLSRYFLALTGINAAFGTAVALCLTFIGVPNPILWGIVAAVLRFIPYIGALIASIFPLALAAAVDPNWTMLVKTGLAFVLLETLMGQVIEPKLFGHTTGLSPLAIIVAASFWTLIWGPAGLLLSTPITACLVVLGRHVESLNFIELLLGDEPPLSPVESFYQRILAADPDEVAFQAENILKDKTLLEYYEEIALPALALAQIDVGRGLIDFEKQIEVRSSVEQVVLDLADHVDTSYSSGTPTDVSVAQLETAVIAENSIVPKFRPTALCLGGRTPLDQAAGTILAQLLERRGVNARIAGPEALSNRGISELDGEGLTAVCVLYLDVRSASAIRYAIRRLRRKLANTPVGVCIWGSEDLSSIMAQAHADVTIGSMTEAIEFCLAPPLANGGAAIAQPPRVTALPPVGAAHAP
jgi:predicted PurR-regulated permease PerM